jgi:cobalamin-dependent methionine synthase I
LADRLAEPFAEYLHDIGRDQIRDYQIRKGLPLEKVERWLGALQFM